MKIDIAKLIVNVKPELNVSMIYLKEAMDMLSSIKIPDDFYYVRLQDIPKNISSIEGEIRSIENWLDGAIRRFGNAEDINKNIINTLGGVLTNNDLYEARDAYYINKILEEEKNNSYILNKFLEEGKNNPRINKILQNENIYNCGLGSIQVILEAEQIHKYMEENEYTYCVLENGRGDECEEYKRKHGLNVTFEESKTGFHNTCCATFVSWVLQEAGYLTREDHTNGGTSMKNKLLEKGWTKVEDISELLPGDVLCYKTSHVDIYAADASAEHGDGHVYLYNAGRGEAIRITDFDVKDLSDPNKNFDFGLRPPQLKDINEKEG